MTEALPVVPPPKPAPYLAGIAPLADELLGRLDRRRLPRRERLLLQAELARIKREIRTARRGYESEIGARIVPELPWSE